MKVLLILFLTILGIVLGEVVFRLLDGTVLSIFKKLFPGNNFRTAKIWVVISNILLFGAYLVLSPNKNIPPPFSTAIVIFILGNLEISFVRDRERGKAKNLNSLKGAIYDAIFIILLLGVAGFQSAVVWLWILALWALPLFGFYIADASPLEESKEIS